jgi:hypothetical protein
MIICVFFAIFSGCKKENSSGDSYNPFPVNKISVIVTGRIVDESNQPIFGATITAGNATATTDLNGNFRINNASLYETAAIVTVEKSGYFKGSRTFFAKENQKHYIEIMLLSKISVGKINATSGGTLNIGNGSAITLPASGIINTTTGNAYTGDVSIAMTWINPTSTDLYRQMPGDLRGIDATGSEQVLQSFGMLGVELTGTSGEKLQIASGKKANIKFPIPSSILATAPSSIALWSFNDTTGLWKQEGTATKTGSAYIADVSHFSFWNCDANFPLARFSAKFINQNNAPLQHALIRIKRTNGSLSYGFTDSTGYVTGQVPSNESLVMEVSSGYTCNTPIFSQNIGPFVTGTTNSLGTITVTIPAQNSISITGTVVNCSNNAVTNGFVKISVGTNNYTAVTNASGVFSLSFLSCSSSPSITYYAVDATNNQQSTTASMVVTNPTTNLGSITACGVSTARYIYYNIDGVNYSILPPTDSISAFTNTQGTTNGTSIYGSASSSTSPQKNIYFSFNGNGVGTYPLTSLSFGTTANQQYIYTPNSSTVTTTEYGSLTGTYITGSFSAILRDSSTNTNHPIQCSFRARR